MSLSKKQKINENKAMDENDLFPASKKLLSIERKLYKKLEHLQLGPPVKYIYNPLIYAGCLHEKFIKKYFENSNKKILFLAMNPGPWGMCQTGIAFGERSHVINWLKITGSVGRPDPEHPKVEVKGLDTHKKEISGGKFWRFFKKLCEDPENFFKYSFVHNLCPLGFFDESGRNIPPPEIQDKEKLKELGRLCGEALIEVINEFSFEVVVAIGCYPEKIAKQHLKLNGIDNKVQVHYMPHPSPLNRKYSALWEETAFLVLKQNNLLRYFNQLHCINYKVERIEQGRSLVMRVMNCGESEKGRIEKWMRTALGFAEEALKNGEVPVGCIFIYNDEIIAKGANTVNETKNATRHAEMNCIDDVLKWCKQKNLDHKEIFKEVEVIVTVEPCIMCSAALFELNIKQIVYGCGNSRFGGCSSVLDVPEVYSNCCKVQGAVYPEKAIDLLKKFYEGTNPNAPKSKVKKKKPSSTENLEENG